MRVKSEQKRQAILNIAKDCFINQGFEQTSMSHIAKRLGGSKATLYNYFSSKEEIFSAVMDSSATEQIASVFLALDSRRDLKTSLLEFGYNFLDSIMTHEVISIYRMAMHEAGRSDIGRQFFEKGPKKGWSQLAEHLRSHCEKGTLKPCDVHLAALQFKALLSAEHLELYALGAIDKPQPHTLKTTTERAVNTFLSLYAI